MPLVTYKPSPGPWTEVDYHKPSRRCIVSRIGTPDERIVATLEWDTSECRGGSASTVVFPELTQRMGNSALIVAAPELLAAAKTALAKLQHKADTCRSSDWKTSDQDAYEALSVAIARAEGRLEAS